MSEFTPAVVAYDATTIEQQIDGDLEASIEGYSPPAGGLAAWITKAFSRILANVGDQAAVSTAAMFKKFGETIANVPPILAAPATVTSTWTVVDEDGHVIEDGTEVKIPVTGDESQGFVVIGDVTIAPGDTSTGAGEVLLQAIEPGEAGNGLSADPTPISTNIFFDTITLDGVTSGGVDEEDEDAYLDRLTEALQLLSLSLIVPRDFEIDARAVAGIARALCIPGYNPDDESEDNPLMLCMVPVDEDGASSSAPVQEDLQERQQAKVPSGVLVKVADATHTKVDAFPEITVAAGFDPATVIASVEARLAVYLSPANWGIPTSGESTGWENRTKVYFNEIISEIDRVQGVDRVVSLTIAKHGDMPGAEDVTLEGIAPLAEPGDIEVSAL